MPVAGGLDAGGDDAGGDDAGGLDAGGDEAGGLDVEPGGVEDEDPEGCDDPEDAEEPLDAAPAFPVGALDAAGLLAVAAAEVWEPEDEAADAAPDDDGAEGADADGDDVCDDTPPFADAPAPPASLLVAVPPNPPYDAPNTAIIFGWHSAPSR